MLPPSPRWRCSSPNERVRARGQISRDRDLRPRRGQPPVARGDHVRPLIGRPGRGSRSRSRGEPQPLWRLVAPGFFLFLSYYLIIITVFIYCLYLLI